MAELRLPGHGEPLRRHRRSVHLLEPDGRHGGERRVDVGGDVLRGRPRGEVHGPGPQQDERLPPCAAARWQRCETGPCELQSAMSNQARRCERLLAEAGAHRRRVGESRCRAAGSRCCCWQHVGECSRSQQQVPVVSWDRPHAPCRSGAPNACKTAASSAPFTCFSSLPFNRGVQVGWPRKSWSRPSATAPGVLPASKKYCPCAPMFPRA